MATTKRPRPEVEPSVCATAEDDDDEWYNDGHIGPRGEGDDEADHPLTQGRQGECKWLRRRRQESRTFGAGHRSYGAAL